MGRHKDPEKQYNPNHLNKKISVTLQDKQNNAIFQCHYQGWFSKYSFLPRENPHEP